MIYALKAPVLGQTHIRYNDVEHRIGRQLILTGQYGTLDNDGNFVPEERIRMTSRTISGEEYDAMQVDSKLPAESLSDFRSDVAASWLDRYGHEVTTWQQVKVDTPAEANEA